MTKLLVMELLCNGLFQFLLNCSTNPNPNPKIHNQIMYVKIAYKLESILEAPTAKC